jgi:hypothetical protein
MIVLKIDLRSSRDGVNAAPTKFVPFLFIATASGGTKPPVPLSLGPGGDGGVLIVD